ncbi:hypothetical protein [Bacillus sp. SJS]|uniref:hypothetical protein n=1 Tax=Bacillus sp. SJS TaxID=1423321 RepID=UPI0004DD0B95|nr:hypothetical protein [Bacillus sp. SJS]KZZ82531.1 hypothetical protein AS29_020755 [Bacillus sp. SJS]
MSLAIINEKYESILCSPLSSGEKSREYGQLMTLMEREFKIPALRDPEWEKENMAVIAMYRKISMSRDL